MPDEASRCVVSQASPSPFSARAARATSLAETPIPPDVIEAAAKALHNCDQLAHAEWEEAGEEHRQWVCGEAEAAIRAADEARGLREERNPLASVLAYGECVRLVFAWRRVEARSDA